MAQDIARTNSIHWKISTHEICEALRTISGNFYSRYNDVDEAVRVALLRKLDDWFMAYEYPEGFSYQQTQHPEFVARVQQYSSRRAHKHSEQRIVDNLLLKKYVAEYCLRDLLDNAEDLDLDIDDIRLNLDNIQGVCTEVKIRQGTMIFDQVQVPVGQGGDYLAHCRIESEYFTLFKEGGAAHHTAPYILKHYEDRYLCKFSVAIKNGKFGH